MISLPQNGYTPLHIAAKKNQMEIGTTLLEYGADANAVTRQGISPIHLAAQEGSVDLVSLLLAKNANVTVCNKVLQNVCLQQTLLTHCNLLMLYVCVFAYSHHQQTGLTPLHLAAQEDRVNVAEVLLNHGADVNLQTKVTHSKITIY